MLLNQYNSKSVTVVFYCCLLLVFPLLTCIVWCVFSSLRWAGCSTALACLLARNLTSIRRALVVFVPCLAVLFERPYYTVLYKITSTIVSSIFPRTYFQNYFCQILLFLNSDLYMLRSLGLYLL